MLNNKHFIAGKSERKELNMSNITILAAREFKKLFKSHVNLSLTVSDIKVNASLRGCSGFVQDIHTGKCAYFNTETGFLDAYLFRTAKDTKDFTGGQNQYSKSKDDLYRNLVRLVS